jgi:hypothetical protein
MSMHRATLTGLALLTLALVGCGGAPPAPDPIADDGEPLEIKIDLPSPPGEPPRGGTAQLTLDSQLVFFSQICPGGSATKRLRLRNRGSDPLIIRGLEVEGQAFWLEDRPRLPATLRKDQALELTVGFAPPADQPDTFEQKGLLRITSSDRRRAVTDVKLSGLVPPQTLALSSRQINFGEIGRGAARNRHLTLRNAGLCPTLIGGADLSGAQAEAIGLSELPGDWLIPGDSGRVTLTARCQRRGEIDATLRFLSASGHTLATASLIGLCR